jgi:hypothetical protein
MHTFGKLLVACIAMCSSVACVPVQQGTPTPEATPTPIIIVEPTPSENGLVYFKATDEIYWDSLEAFYRKNPDLHCDYQGVTEELVEEGYAESRTRYTRITGHILHCHDIAIDAERVTRE